MNFNKNWKTLNLSMEFFNCLPIKRTLKNHHKLWLRFWYRNFPFSTIYLAHSDDIALMDYDKLVAKYISINIILQFILKGNNVRFYANIPLTGLLQFLPFQLSIICPWFNTVGADFFWQDMNCTRRWWSNHANAYWLRHRCDWCI